MLVAVLVPGVDFIFALAYTDILEKRRKQYKIHVILKNIYIFYLE